jgi:hypothetical protein
LRNRYASKEKSEMIEQKGFITRLGEMIDQYRFDRRAQAQEPASAGHSSRLKWLGRQMVPNIGTLVLIIALALAVPTIAGPAAAPLQQSSSTSTISYQGRLADSGGTPITAKQNMEFRLYDVPTGGTPLWTEMWTGGNAVDVSDGLFNVMLGSIATGLEAAIEGYDELYLGITVGTDSEMDPRVQLGSVPFSMQALTVPDGSITTDKIASGAITTTHLLDGAVTQAKLGSDVELVPSYEGFSYYTALYSKPAGWQPLIVDTLQFNTFGTSTYNTSTGTFTAPKAGYYRFMTYGFIGTGATNNERIGLGLSVNGSLSALSGGQFSAGDTPGPHFSHVVYLQTEDTVTLSSYTPIACSFGGAYPWWFQGEYLGE